MVSQKASKRSASARRLCQTETGFLSPYCQKETARFQGFRMVVNEKNSSQSKPSRRKARRIVRAFAWWWNGFSAVLKMSACASSMARTLWLPQRGLDRKTKRRRIEMRIPGPRSLFL